MKNMTKMIVTVIAIIFSFTLSQSVDANIDEWRFELTPYLWATSADIDEATVKGQSASADLDFEDILDLLDFAGFLRFEAWKGNWGFIFDGYYVDLGAEGEYTPQLGPITFATIDADVDYRQTNMDLAVSYRFDLPTRSGRSAWWIDPIGGIRFAYLKEEIDISRAPGPVIGALGTEIEGSEWYVEPFVGAKIGFQLTERLAFALRGDIGGFDIGEASHLTWNLVAGFDYKPWQSVSLKFGYRIYDINWDIGSSADKLGLDIQLHGPALGVTFHF